ncbi:hypothetical protein ACN2MM_07515 [Alkalilimnicola ehrlichii MLHE-1]|uniref:Membrane-associated protein n=1 Tax=Alkalilimnicola ehrlichii (strain ATCC BAA-1101 / DSM 17681 / MLHE-1) TaxID=187272 RepID=Q0A8X3_ALKEH|nr:hypothetical protein [Alkalilimnicola ehrlichii]ABI56714.1 conserved hypothetical protein-putative transmembrane protein [Alkalilimnicola ehrlichii MLHE-1]
MPSSTIPGWLKWGYLGFVAVLVPAYFWWYGPANFLWFSNAALLLGLAGVWLGHRLILSSLLIAVLVPELGWIMGFLSGLVLGGEPPLGVTAYMFDPDIPPFIRALSLYHAVLPFLLLWLVVRLGYDRRAVLCWPPVGWTLLVASYLLSTPEQNINWVFGISEPQQLMPPWLWLAALLTASTLLWGATHLLVTYLLRWSHAAR